jgi:hypothetical protein
MQGQTFESPHADKLIYPVEDSALVVIVAPEAVWDHFGDDGAAEC